jgi:hypothetical protein
MRYRLDVVVNLLHDKRINFHRVRLSVSADHASQGEQEYRYRDQYAQYQAEGIEKVRVGVLLVGHECSLEDG